MYISFLQIAQITCVDGLQAAASTSQNQQWSLLARAARSRRRWASARTLFKAVPMRLSPLTSPSSL